MAAYTGKDANRPKRPQSAYFLWLADFRARVKDRFTENKDILRAGERPHSPASPAAADGSPLPPRDPATPPPEGGGGGGASPMYKNKFVENKEIMKAGRRE